MHYLFILLCLFSCSLNASEIKPFTTDGCSVFPDGDLDNHTKWMNCCIRHDYAYWKGGTKSERELADAELKQCVSELGEDNIATIMHLGVRFGGEPFFPTWYRWGYGWSYARGYSGLSKEESQQVRSRIIELRDLLNEFLIEGE